MAQPVEALLARRCVAVTLRDFPGLNHISPLFSPVSGRIFHGALGERSSCVHDAVNSAWKREDEGPCNVDWAPLIIYQRLFAYICAWKPGLDRCCTLLQRYFVLTERNAMLWDPTDLGAVKPTSV